VGFAEDKRWDKYKDDPHRPGILPPDKKVKIYLGLSTIGMALFLALLWLSP